MMERIALSQRLAAQAAVIAVLACCIAVALPMTAQSTDEVHIVPGTSSTTAKTEVESSDPSLHTRPLRADVDMVLVPVSVTDPLNHPVLSLQKEDFTLYEGAVKQQIRSFSREDGPISVALVLDCSASMKNKIEYEGLALQEFFDNANSEDEYFAVRVSDKPTLIATSSDSIGTLQGRLASPPPQGRTALFDGIYLALSELRNARYQRRALLIISDGGDNTSRYTRGEIKRVIEESDVLTYAIGIFDEEPIPLLKSVEERMGRDWLSELTTRAGEKRSPRTIAARYLISRRR